MAPAGAHAATRYAEDALRAFELRVVTEHLNANSEDSEDTGHATGTKPGKTEK